jgi:hypothetical protein
LELSAKAQIRGVLERLRLEIVAFCRATGEAGVTKPMSFGTWNRVSRARSKTPKPLTPETYPSLVTFGKNTRIRRSFPKATAR